MILGNTWKGVIWPLEATSHRWRASGLENVHWEICTCLWQAFCRESKQDRGRQRVRTAWSNATTSSCSQTHQVMNTSCKGFLPGKKRLDLQLTWQVASPGKDVQKRASARGQVSSWEFLGGKHVFLFLSTWVAEETEISVKAAHQPPVTCCAASEG